MHTLSDINAFGLGSDATDIEMEEFFWNDSFWMPAGWTAPGHKGSKPGLAGTGIVPGESRFLVFGTSTNPASEHAACSRIIASATFMGVGIRDIRQEHRPSDDGIRHDYGRGWAIELDRLSWEKHDIPVNSEMSVFSYRYGILNDDATSFTPVIKNRLAA